MNKIRVMALFLCVVLVGAALGACQPSGGTTPTQAAGGTTAPASTPATGGSTQTAAPAEPEADKLTLPLEETLTIGYFQVFSSKYSNLISSYNDFPYFKWIEEQTNVKFDWNEPSEGSEKEQFGLMIASNDWPDIIQHFNQFYSGGVPAGFDDGIVTNLDPYLADYMPNLSRFYEAFPHYETQALYEGGTHLTLPYFRNDANLYNNGIMIRQDIFEKLNIAIPETMEEFEAALYALKADGVQIPFSIAGSTGGMKPLLWDGTAIWSAWDMKGKEYQDSTTNTVKFGIVEPEFKEVLTMLNKWYADGLLDVDFLTNDTAALNGKISQGMVGTWYGAGGGGGVTPWHAAMDNEPDTEMYVLGIRGLSGQKGQGPKTVDRSDANYQPNQAAIVSTQCENIEEVLLVMDFMGYSPEGIRTMMYGIEDVDYVVDPDGRVNIYVDVDGGAVEKWEHDGGVKFDPKWTGTSGPYLSGIIDYERGTFVHQEDPSVFVPRWFNPNDDSLATKKNIYSATRRATWIVNWMNGDFVNNLPELTFSTEVAARRAELYTPIETYVLEQATAFVLGQRSLDEFDAYVETVKGMGLQTIIDDIQNTLDAYLAK
jgi:putative aldouronate transport system substrate-binding protein